MHRRRTLVGCVCCFCDRSDRRYTGRQRRSQPARVSWQPGVDVGSGSGRGERSSSTSSTRKTVSRVSLSLTSVSSQSLALALALSDLFDASLLLSLSSSLERCPQQAKGAQGGNFVLQMDPCPSATVDARSTGGRVKAVTSSLCHPRSRCGERGSPFFYPAEAVLAHGVRSGSVRTANRADAIVVCRSISSPVQEASRERCSATCRSESEQSIPPRVAVLAPVVLLILDERSRMHSRRDDVHARGRLPSRASNATVAPAA